MTDNQIALIHAASDSVLVERLFSMVRNGNAGAEEFSVIDAEVYQRFARAYGQPLEDMPVETMMAA